MVTDMLASKDNVKVVASSSGYYLGNTLMFVRNGIFVQDGIGEVFSIVSSSAQSSHLKARMSTVDCSVETISRGRKDR